MKYLLTLCFLTLLVACKPAYTFEDKAIPMNYALAAKTLADFQVCYEMMSQNDSIGLNKMLADGRCILATNKHFVPIGTPSRDQNFIYGILYPEGEHVFINQNWYKY
ncbi:hypothetical protein [Halodesulfovibrio marinisediminis]|uniref:Uncharacterized protein n=1 Tax=Halodesulfovibrio marinisediminis DSM 17456 TaxID=1121457 RepID=A0A1N6I264_9BACT|nr:hypothetical protein [Halodesulfovibrio marinisediminis]SIO26097.1 hypothetical protein SAMN02745161_2355 [Halodesulfovibrio marinisediminis DSM 17456]